MAEINKLSVGEALDKLRRTDVQSKQTRLHEKMDALDEEIQRMKRQDAVLSRTNEPQRQLQAMLKGTQGPATKKVSLFGRSSLSLRCSSWS